MQRLNKSITHAVDRPVKVMQFGEGNFLRAFVDYIFDVTNEKTDFNGGVVIVKPIEFGTLERDRKSTRLNSSHWNKSRMPSSA